MPRPAIYSRVVADERARPPRLVSALMVGLAWAILLEVRASEGKTGGAAGLQQREQRGLFFERGTGRVPACR